MNGLSDRKKDKDNIMGVTKADRVMYNMSLWSYARNVERRFALGGCAAASNFDRIRNVGRTVIRKVSPLLLECKIRV